jgi:hypothetical protein
MIINNRKLQDREAGKNVDGETYTCEGYIQSRYISFYDEAPSDVIGIYEF